MIGKDFKALVMSYKSCIGHYYSIHEFMELDEEILKTLILDEESNFVDDKKRNILFETAFMNAEKEFVKLLLNKMKSINYEGCIILQKIAETINKLELHEGAKMSYLTAICKYGYDFNSLNELSNYFRAAEKKANIDYVNVFKNEVIVGQLTKLKLEIAKLEKEEVTNLFEAIISSLSHIYGREMYREDFSEETSFSNTIIKAMYEKVELLTSYYLKEELYSILANINHYTDRLNSKDVINLLNILENIKFSEVNDRKNLVNRILSDNKYYDKILEVCDAFGVEINEQTYDLILRICKSEDEVYEKYITFARKHHINECEYDLSICLDSTNYDRLEEMSRLIGEGNYTVEELLDENRTLYNEIGSTLYYDDETLDKILSSVPDDVEIKKETLSFRLKNTNY